MWHILHQHQQSYCSKKYLLSVSFLLSEWSEEGYEEPSHFTQCLMSIYHNETVSFDVADDDMLPSWYQSLAFAHTTVTGDPAERSWCCQSTADYLVKKMLSGLFLPPTGKMVVLVLRSCNANQCWKAVVPLTKQDVHFDCGTGVVAGGWAGKELYEMSGWV